MIKQMSHNTRLHLLQVNGRITVMLIAERGIRLLGDVTPMYNVKSYDITILRCVLEGRHFC